MKFQETVILAEACDWSGAIKWVGDKTAVECWNKCRVDGWMEWFVDLLVSKDIMPRKLYNTVIVAYNYGYRAAVKYSDSDKVPRDMECIDNGSNAMRRFVSDHQIRRWVTALNKQLLKEAE